MDTLFFAVHVIPSGVLSDKEVISVYSDFYFEQSQLKFKCDPRKGNLIVNEELKIDMNAKQLCFFYGKKPIKSNGKTKMNVCFTHIGEIDVFGFEIMSSESLPSETRVETKEEHYLYGKKTHLSYFYFICPKKKKFEAYKWDGVCAHVNKSTNDIGLKNEDVIIVSVDMDEQNTLLSHEYNDIDVGKYFHFALLLASKTSVCVEII